MSSSEVGGVVVITYFLFGMAFAWERLRGHSWLQPRPGDSDRHLVPVPTSEAVDGRSAEAVQILLRRGHPRFELTATLLTPMNWELRVDCLTDVFVGRTSRSMPEPTKSTLKIHRGQSSKMELTVKDDARYKI